MKLFCANCGRRLEITRIALPKYSTVVDAVQYHECSDEITILELKPDEFAPIKEGKDKFVRSLDGLRSVSKPPNIKEPNKTIFGGVGTDNLRDQRVSTNPDVKSSAPVSVLSMIERMNPTEPANEIENEPESGE